MLRVKLFAFKVIDPHQDCVRLSSLLILKLAVLTVVCAFVRSVVSSDGRVGCALLDAERLRTRSGQVPGDSGGARSRELEGQGRKVG
jgi:hypothetical protein